MVYEMWTTMSTVGSVKQVLKSVEIGRCSTCMKRKTKHEEICLV